MKKIIACLLLTGCHAVTHYPGAPHTLSKSIVTDTRIKVNWHKDVDSVQKSCNIPSDNIFYGCARAVIQNGKSTCEINVIEPRDFNDEALLTILGHEVWHCLGARHN